MDSFFLAWFLVENTEELDEGSNPSTRKAALRRKAVTSSGVANPGMAKNPNESNMK